MSAGPSATTGPTAGAGPGASLAGRLAGWASGLTYDDVPEATVAAARSQLISNLAAARASLRHPTGRRLVAAFGRPDQADPARAAYVLAALATAFDFDEVAFSGHPSAGAVNVALSETVAAGRDGRALLATIVAGTECASRITAATILSPFFRGQTNTHTHLAGAAAARLHARGAGPEEWTAALGLALGILAVPLHYGVLAGDAKALSAAAPVRMALDACTAAAHGLAGPERILEHPEGLLAHLSVVPLPELVTAGLGRRWHTDTLTYKRFPGSAYLHAAFECAQRLHERLGPLGPDRVRRVTVHGSLLTYQLDRKVAGSLDGPRTTPSAATLSVGYGVAALLTTGRFGVPDFEPAALADPARWELAGRVRVEHDWSCSLAMAAATSPLGQALREAGERALHWPELRDWAGADGAALLASLGRPEETFEQATMAIGARLELELADGSTVVEDCPAPVGSAGPQTRRRHEAIAAEKFLDTGGDTDVLSDLERIDRLGAAATRQVLVRALDVARTGPSARAHPAVRAGQPPEGRSPAMGPPVAVARPAPAPPAGTGSG